MRTLLHILASLLLVILLGAGAQYWATSRDYTVSGIDALQAQLQRRQPRLVMLGNSILQRGVDDEQLSRSLGYPCMSIFQEGAASAWWYLALKNVVASADPKPEQVYILFRDHYLTEPTFRTQGKFREQLNMLRLPEEPLLEERAHVAGQTMGTAFLSRAWPFYQVRYQYRRALDRRTQALVGSAFGISVLDLANLTESVFAPDKLDQELFTRQQFAAESAADLSVYEFEARLAGSFLPAMLSIAAENQINLSFIRFKRLRDITPGKQPAALRSYMQQLSRYLESRGSSLLDLTDVSGLTSADYADGDHLSDAGRRRFTAILAALLAAESPQAVTLHPSS